MNINNCNFEDLYLKGVYSITNLESKKVYYGSTSQYFYKRWSQHLTELKAGTHKNENLQIDFDNSIESNFLFTILEIFDILDLEKMLECEELLILKNFGESCYNINPFAARPYCYGKSLEKRLNTLSKTNDQIRKFYNDVKLNKIQIEDVPSKYFKRVSYYLTRKIWNKGLKSGEIDYSFLKGITKTKTTKWKESREQFKITQREKGSKIHIYDYRGLYLCTFRSITDIVEFSKNENHFLPLILMSPFKRKSRKQTEGIDIFKLGTTNIERVCKGKSKHHKGLIFRYSDEEQIVIPLKPSDIKHKQEKFRYFYFRGELLLSEEILIEKLDNIGEVFQSLKDNTEIIERIKELSTS